MASSSSESSSGRRRRRSKQNLDEPKKHNLLVGLCFVTILAAAVFLFFKLTDDGKSNQPPPPEAVAAAANTPPPSPAGEPTPPADLNLTLEQYCDKLASLEDNNVVQTAFIKQTAGSRIKWRAKVFSVGTTDGNVALSSVNGDAGKYRVKLHFEHPTQDVVDCLLQLRPQDVVQVSGTLSTSNSHRINGDDMRLTR